MIITQPCRCGHAWGVHDSRGEGRCWGRGVSCQCQQYWQPETSAMESAMLQHGISVAPDQSLPGTWAAWRGDFAPLSARASTPGEAVSALVAQLAEA